jgi:hypothetical protein
MIDRTEAGMKKFIRPICFGLLIAAALQPVLAQVGAGGGGGGRRVQGQGINYAPQAEVYAVLSIDLQDRTVQLRATDGRTGFVHVGESVYDLSKLKAGDRIKVDFVVPDESNNELQAASIWPEK